MAISLLKIQVFENFHLLINYSLALDTVCLDCIKYFIKNEF